jgi:ADP-ribosylglycohydrolase
VKAWNGEDAKLQKFSSDDISMGVSGTEAVPVALGFFSLSEGEPLATIRLSAGYGRDCDTIAGIGGAIAGAFKGAKSIKNELIQRVNLANNVSLETTAERMIEPIKNTWKEGEESARIGRSLLG